MGRPASIQPMTSDALNLLSHSAILFRKGGPLYLIYDWFLDPGAEQISDIEAPFTSIIASHLLSLAVVLSG